MGIAAQPKEQTTKKLSVLKDQQKNPPKCDGRLDRLRRRIEIVQEL